MKITLVSLFGLFMFTGIADAQNLLTGKEIYRVNCKAVVEIGVDGNFSGAGFITSSDGIIMTANHVVATRESSFRQYANHIQVMLTGMVHLSTQRLSSLIFLTTKLITISRSLRSQLHLRCRT